MHLLSSKIFKLLDIIGKDIQFTEEGDGPANYEVFNYRKVARNQYRYMKIGKWHNGALIINESRMHWNRPGNVPPPSKCSRECELGYRKALIKDEICCWACIQCDDYEYMVRNPTL